MSARDPQTTSKIMRAIRSKDSRAELALRRELHRLGRRYRLHPPDLPGKPDLVFRGRKIAVFVDGDFWHGRDVRKIDRTLRRNRDYWLPKIQRTIERDSATTLALEDAGWTVLRFWETDVLRDPLSIARQVLDAVRTHRPTVPGLLPSSTKGS